MQFFFVNPSIVSKVSSFIFFPILKIFKLSELVKNYSMAKKIPKLSHYFVKKEQKLLEKIHSL
jgi:hypothetical protein